MTPRVAKRLRGFSRDRRGATALEFAILGLPFMLAMLAILEYGYVYLIDATLDNATAAAARQIRTGQLQTSTDQTNSKQQQFKNAVCNNMQWIGNCQASLQVSAETQSSWTNQSSTSPTLNGQMKTTLPFNIGTDGCIVLVHSYFPWQMVTPSLWTANTKLSNNSILLSSANLIVNEPYSAGSQSTPPPSSC